MQIMDLSTLCTDRSDVSSIRVIFLGHMLVNIPRKGKFH